MRRYLADTSLVFAVIIAICGVLALLQSPADGIATLLVAFVMFAFSFMVKRY